MTNAHIPGEHWPVGGPESFEVAPTPEARRREWFARRMLFVTGPHASGKSAVVKAALTDGFALFDTGPILREYHRSAEPDLSFGRWVDMNERQYGTNFTDELLRYHIQTAIATETVEHSSGIVVVGNRSAKGVAYLESELAPPDSRIVYVDAPTDVLHERYKTREGKHDITDEEFAAILDADIQMGLAELIEVADFHMANDGGLDMAAQQLRYYMDAWQPESL